MKVIGIILMLIGVILILSIFSVAVFANYSWENNIYSNWSLADKSSTIEAKSEHIDKFVEAIENSGTSGHNAIILKTPDNSFEKNFSALKTLQSRLEQIKKMDVNSFEYQQAISQITQQEQGEAEDMIANIKGAWKISHFPFIITWRWIAMVCLLFAVISFMVGFVFYDED